MSVWIYKGDESQLIDPNHLEGALAGGWSVTKEGDQNVRFEEKTNEQEKAIEQNANVGQQEEVRHEEKANEEDEIESLRQKAKDAGIKSWHRMSKETLIEKLNECEL